MGNGEEGTQPRPMTQAEVRKALLDEVLDAIDECEHEPAFKTAREKLEALAYEMLSIFDGRRSLPPFVVEPAPKEGHDDHSRELGHNWYPDPGSGCNVSGDLHERFWSLRDDKRGSISSSESGTMLAKSRRERWLQRRNLSKK